MAVGFGAVAATAGGAGSAPTGASASQIAVTRATTRTQAAVSVGDTSNGEYRQITGVAAGSADSDAANVAQVRAASSTVAAGSAEYATNPDRSVNYGNLVLGTARRRTARASATGRAVLPPNDAVNVAQLSELRSGMGSVACIAYSGCYSRRHELTAAGHDPGKSLPSINTDYCSGYAARAVGFSARSEGGKWPKRSIAHTARENSIST
ncbi:autotransporter adhesin [Variovorax boronicumulans]|uniref:adhesin n=1 Tax=Variovorax boronicumulans TaxID=436515 RepID=UPI0027895BB7|nr:adhesin [Variovorax boronicumulans]MDQ0015379.1 autotransporter adhesin [Variovorax boronicumulans]